MTKIVRRLIQLLPLRNIILFESAPDYTDNTRAVFDELVKRRMWEKYKLVWANSSKNSKPPDHSIAGFRNKFTAIYYQYCARCLISCNRFLTVKRKGQIAIHLSHGTPVKSVHDYYTLPDGIDYIITASEEVKELIAYEVNCSINKCVALGFPRNDVLNNCKIDLESIFGRFKKYIIWYPTVRQFRNGRKAGSGAPLPLIDDEKRAASINECAKTKDVLIIIKPHYAQDTSYIKKMDLSNITIIDDFFLKQNRVDSYKLVGSSDALLTDYSSIYFDYLLCDKPIGLIWDDIEEYKKNPGVIREFDTLMQGGKPIYTADQLCTFIDDVSSGVDELKTKRNTICDIVNYSRDGNATNRVTDFVIEKASLLK